MEENSQVLNWENIFKQSKNFKEQKPTRFAFIENIFFEEFYKDLFESYPNLDTFVDGSDHSKSQLSKSWKNATGKYVAKGDDPQLSDSWNKFKRYLETKECVTKFSEFSGVNVKRLKQVKFLAYRKGGFQLPHVHNVSKNELVMLFYFSKGWKQGDPGGTYISSDLDESSIIFEPYNLDNSACIFQDGPKAFHGMRMITKDVERRGFQITMEG